MRRSAFACLLLIACGPRDPHTAAHPTLTAASEQVAKPTTTPELVRGPDYVFVPRLDRPKLTQLPGGMGFFWPSPRAGTYLVENATVDARLVSPELGKPFVLKDTKVYRHAWSPSGARLATVADGDIRVWSTTDGKVVRAFADRTEALTMPDETHVHWYGSDCRVHTLDLEKADSMPIARGDSVCGTVRTNDAGSAWLVVAMSNADRVTVIGDVSAATHLLEKSFFGTTFDAPWLSNDGARVCFQSHDQTTWCTRSFDSPVLDRVATQSSQWGVFDPTSTRYLTSGRQDDGSSWIVVVDFAARTVRRIVEDRPEWGNFSFVSSSDRVVVYGSGSVQLFDLAAGWTMVLVDDPKVDTGPPYTVPGRLDQLVIEQTTKGQPSYFSYLAELPAWSKP